MLSTSFLVICVVGSYLALDENEWRGVAVELYYNFTESFGLQRYDKFVNLFNDDSVVLLPDGRTTGEGGLKPYLWKTPISSEYFGFLELLYSSPDVAVTRYVAYRKQTDGMMKKIKGVVLLVRENREVRVKMAVFNYF